MTYRTKTYIAADWDGDKDVVEQLYSWQANKSMNFDFHDAHEITQARDTSLCCTIKKSLDERLKASKIFVLIVGSGTKALRKGGCQYCPSYDSGAGSCLKGYAVDYDSYIEHECKKAVKDGLKIVVLYKSSKVDRSKCPDSVSGIGTHVPMLKSDGKYDYQRIKGAIEQQNY